MEKNQIIDFSNIRGIIIRKPDFDSEDQLIDRNTTKNIITEKLARIQEIIIKVECHIAILSKMLRDHSYKFSGGILAVDYLNDRLKSIDEMLIALEYSILDDPLKYIEEIEDEMLILLETTYKLLDTREKVVV